MGFLGCLASIDHFLVCLRFFFCFCLFVSDYNINAPQFTLPGYAEGQIQRMHDKLLAENSFQSKEGVSLTCLKKHSLLIFKQSKNAAKIIEESLKKSRGKSLICMCAREKEILLVLRVP